MSSVVQEQRAERLDPGDFGTFFVEVHGYSPFPWQEALLDRVIKQGWPDLIDVPTGLGKTAILDVAVFLSALGSEHARRRIYLVVDRRLIVDQAYNEARKIRGALAAPPGSVSRRVRDALRVTGDDAHSTIDVTRMRGGLNWSWLWLERPDRHAIVTGTVDQIGSRLLFRGYGVGERLRSIDAALVGTDSLIIVDEAHLSDPLLTTLHDVRALDGGGVGARPVVVAMSASPEKAGEAAIHRITAADEAHPVASKRLIAPKELHPVTVTASSANAATATADALAHWARQLGGPGKVVGVVANTVAMARAAFENIQAASADPVKCVLLTGRVRPIDREYLVHDWYPKIHSGAERDGSAELYVVATQTIEAGADIDLDGMVTESASLAATVQRLGRVNRLGERGEAHVVVVHADKAKDLVYGPTSDATWQWISSLKTPTLHTSRLSLAHLGEGLPVSPAALRKQIERIPSQTLAGMRTDKQYVPLVSTPTLDAWVRTSPAPCPDVPVEPYLHGIGVGEPTVGLVWRADISGIEPLEWTHTAERIPPSTEEAVEVPISAVRRWLAQPVPEAKAGAGAGAGAAGQSLDLAVATSDLESQAMDEAADSERLVAGGGKARHALRYRPSGSEPVDARQVRPGDLLVVPSSWGGCDRFGWSPSSPAPVTDLADLSSRGSSAVVRVGPQLAKAMHVLAPDLAGQVEELISRIQADIRDENVDDRSYWDEFGRLVDANGRLPHERVLRRLAKAGRVLELTADQHDDATPDQAVAALFAARATAWSDDDSPASSSAAHPAKRITLAAHQRAVGCRAREIASNLGLSSDLVEAVRLAGIYHDEGKRDRRFQVMLHRGDKLRAEAATEPLAKSGMDPADKAALRRAAELSGYPKGMRHEAYSAKIAEILLQRGPGDGQRDEVESVDRELVVHLVASHHGCGRPLLPPVVDLSPIQVTRPVAVGEPVVVCTADSVDWAGPARFDALCRRYGRWGLALLESIVRLADIWCSARSEERNNPPEGRDDSES